MKVRVFEYDYEYSRNYSSDYFDVTEEEYNLLSKFYSLEVIKDKEYYIDEAKKRKADEERRLSEYRKKEKEKSEKAKKAALTRKQNLLKKLQAELGEQDG